MNKQKLTAIKLKWEIISLWLLLFLAGCSPKNAYRFQAPNQLWQPTSLTIIHDSNAALSPQNLLLASAENQNYNTLKVNAILQNSNRIKLTNKNTKAAVPAKGLQVKNQIIKERNAENLLASKKSKLKSSAIWQKFPVVWFIILSAILSLLLILFATSEPGMPSFEEIFLLLMIPFAIPWLIIVGKVLAPALGWPVFWTVMAMIGAIILFILFANWLTKVQENARRARRLKESEERQKRDPATY